MTDKQLYWIKSMMKTIDKWVDSVDMSHVWNVKYHHIKYMINNNYYYNFRTDTPASSYRTSLMIAFLEDSYDKAKANRRDINS